VRKKPRKRRGPMPIAASPGPMLPVLPDITLVGAPEAFIALTSVRASRWWVSGAIPSCSVGCGT
jgi:hypothetical protein